MEASNHAAATVVALRPQRGYSAAKDDGKSAGQVKSLRREFGQIYDANSARNSSCVFSNRAFPS